MTLTTAERVNEKDSFCCSPVYIFPTYHFQNRLFRILHSSVLWGSTPVCSINYPSSPFIGSSKSPLRGREAFVGGWYRVGQHYTLTINQCSEKTASVSHGEGKLRQWNQDERKRKDVNFITKSHDIQFSPICRGNCRDFAT